MFVYVQAKEQLITLQSFALHLLQVLHSPHSSSTPSLSQVVLTNLMAQMMHFSGRTNLVGLVPGLAEEAIF